MDLAVDVLSWILLITGSLFAMTGALGLLRLPDFFSRAHGGGVTDTMGAGLILFGLMLQSGLSLITFKLVLILVFLFITSPTSVHALAQSALSHGLRPLVREEGEELATREVEEDWS
jgi:multicomponent Na+:H+ antiporter subunit G